MLAEIGELIGYPGNKTRIAGFCEIDRSTLYNVLNDRHETENATVMTIVEAWRRAHAKKAGYGNEPPAVKLDQVLGALNAMSQPAREKVAAEIHDRVMRALQDDVNARFAFPKTDDDSSNGGGDSGPPTTVYDP